MNGLQGGGRAGGGEGESGFKPDGVLLVRDVFQSFLDDNLPGQRRSMIGVHFPAAKRLNALMLPIYQVCADRLGDNQVMSLVRVNKGP
jgi:hypothetical protein